MAEAYASLLSITQILDHLQNHPRPPISVHKHQVHSLTQVLTFLQEFLELNHNHAAYSKQVDSIADAAHTAHDVIESHIVNRILVDCEEVFSVDFYDALQKVIDDMGSVKREIMVMREKMEVDSSASTASSIYVASSNSASVGQNQTMVGFDDILLEVLDKLTNHKSSRQIISITGMGGIGKTTLVRNVYQHGFVVEHFDFLAWFTISQNFNIGKILSKVLVENGEILSLVDEDDLGCKLHQMLLGRRYLIIIDDIWNTDDWDRLNKFMPDNNNGSRIMITTRLSNLARHIDDSHNIVMDFMDENNSWTLFCKHVFVKEDCPLELNDIGRNIVRSCKGLPLSIAVVGGLLAKSYRTQQYWEFIAENLNSIVNLDNNEHCLQILYMSYTSLPIYLKSCFLSLGYYDEDDVISFLVVIQMWVGDGIVKPMDGKSLEEVAKEYLTELIDRNLILIEGVMSEQNWMFKSCKIHDLLRDLCLRECEKQKFLMVAGVRSSRISHNIRRIRVPEFTREEEVLHIMESNSLVRSLILEPIMKSLVSFKLLRVAILKGIHNLEDIGLLVNLRFILIICTEGEICRILSSISRFWNLQTIIFNCSSSNRRVLGAQLDIWNMPQLRMILVDRLSLQDPPSGEGDMSDGCIILENVHTFSVLYNFKCSEEVVKRIPHIKFLELNYAEVEVSSFVDYYLNNLGCLQELKHLVIRIEMQGQIVQNLMITFPHSLKFLYLGGTTLHWDDVSTKIGSLPLLLLLQLSEDSCTGAQWEKTEGQFCKLEYLEISKCGDLEFWITEKAHFPCLEHLILEGLHKLYEIPSSIGEIPTLQYIGLKDCSDSACDSAERIKEEQEEFENEDLQVQVCRSMKSEVQENDEEDEIKSED